MFRLIARFDLTFLSNCLFHDTDERNTYIYILYRAQVFFFFRGIRGRPQLQCSASWSLLRHVLPQTASWVLSLFLVSALKDFALRFLFWKKYCLDQDSKNFLLIPFTALVGGCGWPADKKDPKRKCDSVWLSTTLFFVSEALIWNHFIAGRI